MSTQTRLWRRFVVCLCFGTWPLAVACEGAILGERPEVIEREGEADTSLPPPPPEEDPLLGEPTPGDGTPTDVPVTDRGDGELVPVRPRARRRMDIDQLSAAIRQVTGGIGWTESDGDDLFEELSATLGKPDLIESTSEDTEASLLFARFLGEAARTTCTELAEAERDGAREPLVLMVEAGPGDRDGALVDANLARLLMRFHSRKLTPDSAQFVPWRELFDGALAATDDPVLAWRTVCVGLISHPDFYSY